jgi:hypothetical protein
LRRPFSSILKSTERGIDGPSACSGPTDSGNAAATRHKRQAFARSETLDEWARVAWMAVEFRQTWNWERPAVLKSADLLRRDLQGLWDSMSVPSRVSNATPFGIAPQMYALFSQCLPGT